MSGVTSTISSLFGGGPSSSNQSNPAEDSYLGYRFTVEVKSGPTAKILFNNLLLLARQNSTLQQVVKDHHKKKNKSSSLTTKQSNKQKKASDGSKKRNRTVSLNDDDEDEEDDANNNGEIELESSDDEDDEEDGVLVDDDQQLDIQLPPSSSGLSGADEDSDGEIKLGEEGKSTSGGGGSGGGDGGVSGGEPKRKRLRKEKDNVANKKNKKRDRDDLFDEESGAGPWGQSRLGGVIYNIVSRERSIKNSLIQKQPGELKEKGDDKKGKSNRRGDFYVYESDDSFIDDTEYMDYIDDEPMGDAVGASSSSNKKASDFYVVTKLTDQGGEGDNEYGSDVSLDDIDLDQEEEEDNHGLDITSIPVRTKASFEDDDIFDTTLEPELEKALDDLNKKSATLEKSTHPTIPHELDQELMSIAVLREKFYKRGVPKKLLVRLRAINGLQFTDKTIKDRLKLVLQQFSSSSITTEIDKLKESFGESMREDMIRALVNKKKDKDGSNKSDENTEKTYRALTHEELKQKVNEVDSIRLVWSKNTTDIFLKLCHSMEEWVTKQNDVRKTKKEDTLETNEELLRLFRELKAYLFKTQDLMKKYKTLKEKDNKKDETGKGTESSTSSAKKQSETDKKDEPKPKKKKASEDSSKNESSKSEGKEKEKEKEKERPAMRRRKIKRPEATPALVTAPIPAANSVPAEVLVVSQDPPSPLSQITASLTAISAQSPAQPPTQKDNVPEIVDLSALE